MSTIDYKDLVAAGKKLLAYAESTRIPYVLGGMSLAGMDCQGLCEYLLMQCGLSKSEVDLSGSNAHWRHGIKWRGSVEAAVALFGDIPEGAWIFIHVEGANSKYKDNDGDANHMGQYLENLVAVHASSSREGVFESAVKRKSINGGWNKVFLSNWVRYSDKVEALLGNTTTESPTGGETESTQTTPVIAVNTAVVVSNTLRARTSLSTKNSSNVKMQMNKGQVLTDIQTGFTFDSGEPAVYGFIQGTKHPYVYAAISNPKSGETYLEVNLPLYIEETPDSRTPVLTVDGYQGLPMESAQAMNLADALLAAGYSVNVTYEKENGQ